MEQEIKNYNRLKEAETIAIKETLDIIKKKQSSLDDYVVLKNKLLELPDKLSYDIMVPFGKKAFMPGLLVNTNSVTMLLGDNWFAKVSTKDASGIIGRRIEALSEKIGDLRKQQELFENELKATNDYLELQRLDDVVEIKEDYDEEEDRQWKKKRSALRAAQSKEKQESIINANLKPDSNVGKNTQSHEEDRTTNNIINKHECVKSEQNIDISSKENNEDILKFGKCQFFENEDDEDDDEDKENSDESKENKVWKLINELSKLETTYNNSIETTDNPIETSSCKDNNDVVQEFISKSGDDLLTKSIVVTSDGEEEDVSDENDGELRSTVHFRHSNAEPYKYSKFSTSLQSPADLYFSYKNCIKKPLKKKVSFSDSVSYSETKKENIIETTDIQSSSSYHTVQQTTSSYPISKPIDSDKTDKKISRFKQERLKLKRNI